MTNETTASQPKMKCVEPEDWPAHYDKNDPTKGTNMDSVVFGTSQPKSIGDDAQFQKRLTEYDAAIYPGQKALRLVSLIALIDRRAPAVQASATIQAAPRVPTEEMQNAARDWAVKKYGIGIGKDAALGCWQAMWDAATIQEPVMVAEPDGKIKELAEALTIEYSPISITWDALIWAVKSLVKYISAAPMVADPAGVAGPWVVRERRDKETGKLLDCFVEAPKEGNMAYALEVLGDDYSGYGNVERKLEYCKLIVSSVNASLAATVKAVPSEARDTKLLDALGNESWNLECFDMPTGGDDADIGWRVVGHYMAEPIRRIVAEVYEDNPRAAIKAALAAPLADKTGGGE